jgi:predicted nucleotidyltransferase
MILNIDNYKNKLLEICRRNDIAFMAVFGSSLRKDFGENSDVDLLVRFSKPKSLLDLVRIERFFSEALGRKADLLTESSISPYLKTKIKQEMQVVYERAG